VRTKSSPLSPSCPGKARCSVFQRDAWDTPWQQIRSESRHSTVRRLSKGMVFEYIIGARGSRITSVLSGHAIAGRRPTAGSRGSMSVEGKPSSLNHTPERREVGDGVLMGWLVFRSWVTPGRTRTAQMGDEIGVRVAYCKVYSAAAGRFMGQSRVRVTKELPHSRMDGEKS
jgi:hypothetical protein